MRLDPLTAYRDDPIGNTVHHPYSAFNQGWDAAEAGHPVEANPYRSDTRWWASWRDGWVNYADGEYYADDFEPWESDDNW